MTQFSSDCFVAIIFLHLIVMCIISNTSDMAIVVTDQYVHVCALIRIKSLVSSILVLSTVLLTVHVLSY